MIANFLPQDTRIAELYGGIGLAWIAAMTALGGINLGALEQIHPPPFWSLLFAALGTVQIWAVALYPRADVMRVIMSWVNGALWLWLALIGYGDVTPTDPAAWLLGIGNLYAFVINVTFLKRQWN